MVKKSRRNALGPRRVGVGIGSILVAMRKHKGWEQAYAAERIGITSRALRGLETGDCYGLVEEWLVRAADVYGASMDQVFGRGESAVDRFTTAPVETQSALIEGIMSALSRLAQNHDVLTFVDELVSMFSRELPDWETLQKFRDLPSRQRMSMFQQLVLAVARMASDRRVINYIGALVLHYAGKGAAERRAYSLARVEQVSSQRHSDIDVVFGRTEQKREQLTPSRFFVKEVVPERSPGKPARASKKKQSDKKSSKKAAKKK